MSFANPTKGDLFIFDGWNFWPFDKKDPVAMLTLKLSGISLYEYDGEKCIKIDPETVK